jgi:hypothetical protein
MSFAGNGLYIPPSTAVWFFHEVPCAQARFVLDIHSDEIRIEFIIRVRTDGKQHSVR